MTRRRRGSARAGRAPDHRRAAGLAACSGTGDITVLDTTVVTWPGGGNDATAGQVIVSVRNDADEPVDPDVLGNDRLTLAQLRGDGGDELTER